MAAVQGTRGSKHARRGLTEDEPTEHVESAGELLIKQLVQKQTETQVTLEQQMQLRKDFQRGQGFVSLTELTPGATSLQKFQQTVGALESKQEEMGVQLTDQNLRFAIPIGRQEHELALSVKPNSVETRLYQFAMRNTSSSKAEDPRPANHPINQLSELEQRLLQSADPQATAKIIRRKRRQIAEAESDRTGVCYKAPEKGASLWDAIEPPAAVEGKPAAVNRTYMCKKQTLYTVRDGKIVQLSEQGEVNSKTERESELKQKPSGQAFVSLQSSNEIPSISERRLTEEEIKKLPRFQNYERGKESRTLYIKNLSNNLTESDLAAAFDKFHVPSKESVIFRLMNGRMRGQAFVTFPDLEISTKALEEMNGVTLKGKPMVIQYGNQKD